MAEFSPHQIFSKYTDIKTLMRVLKVSAVSSYRYFSHHLLIFFQGRMVVLKEAVTLAPFFFVEPDYASSEAQGMIKSMESSEIR